MTAAQRYEVQPMRGIEHAPENSKAWMVIEVNTPEQNRIGHSPHIICWSHQGRPERNKADAQRVADALNGAADDEGTPA